METTPHIHEIPIPPACGADREATREALRVLRDERDGDYERDDPLVLFCNTPGCLMPGEHFLSECHTAEDMEAEMDIIRIENCRADVQTFACEMERKLRARDDECGDSYRQMTPQSLFYSMLGEVGELADAMRREQGGEVWDEAVDVGNLAMMILVTCI